MPTEHRLAFYADIHYVNDGAAEDWKPEPDLDVEAILFGGDIHYKPEFLGRMLTAIRRTQRPETTLVIVPGNGDYWAQELEPARGHYREVVAEIPNAVFLDDESVTLPSGLRIIGSTLWSHIPEAEMPTYEALFAQHGIVGVDNITRDGAALSFHNTNGFHAVCSAYVEKTLSELTPEERRRTVMCTHFWPTQRWLNPDHELYGHRMIIASDLDAMIERVGPALWLCGHLHESHDVTIGATRVVSNPRAGNGRGALNPAFRDPFVVSVPHG